MIVWLLLGHQPWRLVHSLSRALAMALFCGVRLWYAGRSLVATSMPGPQAGPGPLQQGSRVRPPAVRREAASSSHAHTPLPLRGY
jgi:hypothetical protein